MSETKALREFLESRRQHANSYPDAYWEIESINQAAAELDALVGWQRDAERWLDAYATEIAQLRTELEKEKNRTTPYAVLVNENELLEADLTEAIKAMNEIADGDDNDDVERAIAFLEQMKKREIK